MNTQEQLTHPTSEALVAFAHGRLDDDTLVFIADHLGVCDTCQQAVLAVPDDPMMSLLRPDGSMPMPLPELPERTAPAFDDDVPAELLNHARYKVLRKLGAGGMGVVYKAEHRLMERTVALKVISKQLTASPAVVERFRREVRAVAKLSHPNLVQAHDAEQEGDLHFLVMEFVEGENLSWLVDRNGPLPIATACDYVRQAAQGLAHALTLGLVHRDVKPQNLIVTPRGQVKVLDFGLASIAEERAGAGGLTEYGQGMGTPDYVAPEQVRDAHSVDARADVYSLGCTLYFLLTGLPPFPDGGPAQKMAAHLEKRPTPVQQLRPELPVELVQVIERMMDKEPARRYQTAEEVVATMEPWCQALPEANCQVQAVAGAGRQRRRKRLVIAAGMVVVLILAVVWLFPTRKPSPPPPDPRVLTVSKNPKDGARFSTIQAALDEVEPEMTIRVMDDAIYEEMIRIDRPDLHRGVVLEAVDKATIRKLPDESEAVQIRGVTGFILRGFRFVGRHEKTPHSHVFIDGNCPGVVLDRLDMTNGGPDCVDLFGVRMTDKDIPLVIKNCTIRGPRGVRVEGAHRNNLDNPRPCGQVVIRNNTLVGCANAISLQGKVHNVHVVGNLFNGSTGAAIELCDFLPGTRGILVANNTLFKCDAAVSIWDDHAKEGFLECKNIRIQNNLVFETSFAADMVFSNHRRGTYKAISPCDMKSLLNSPQWRFSHNYREINQKRADREEARWIPLIPTDRVMLPIKVLSRTFGDPNFLRPPKDSPLATGGVNDGTLPAYVGAVPPEGVEEWDWEKTWRAMSR